LNFLEGFSDFSLKLDEAFTGNEEFFFFGIVFIYILFYHLIKNVSILFQSVAKNTVFSKLRK